MNRICVIGSAVVDIILKSNDFKVIKSHEVETGVGICEVYGGKTEASYGEVTSGGGGTNVAVGLHRLGESVRLISKIGNDSMAKVILSDLEKEMIDTSLVIADSRGKTGFSSILVTDHGSRSVITFRGTSKRISSKEIDWNTIERSDWVQISSLGGDVDLLEDVILFCFERGVRVGLNPGRSEILKGIKKSVLEKLDLLSVNRYEASLMVDLNYEDEDSTIKKMAGLGPRVVTITDGKKGASYIYNNCWVKMSSTNMTSVDDTGAGDAFVSGFVFGYINNMGVEKSLKMGILNSGSVVTHVGAKDGLLRVSEIEERMKKRIRSVEKLI